MPTKYTKVGRPYEYIAARVPGPFDPFPFWFNVLAREGKLKIDAESGAVTVRVITGQWWQASVGDWVVLQRGGDVYLIEHGDFVRMFKEVTN